MRMARVRYDRERCYHHLTNRVAGEAGFYPFGDVEKERLCQLSVQQPSPNWAQGFFRLSQLGRSLAGSFRRIFYGPLAGCPTALAGRLRVTAREERDGLYVTGGSVLTPVGEGGTVWQAYDRKGDLQDAPNWLVLGHELCGHAMHMDAGTHDPRPQPKNNRPGHDQAINEENKLAREHGLGERGLFKDPKRGESAFRPGVAK